MLSASGSEGPASGCGRHVDDFGRDWFILCDVDVIERDARLLELLGHFFVLTVVQVGAVAVGDHEDQAIAFQGLGLHVVLAEYRSAAAMAVPLIWIG